MSPVAPLLASDAPVFTVSELLTELQALLRDAIGRVWVVGEVSNLRRASSGHRYFTLKDDGSQVRAVLFRGSAQYLPFEIEDGLEVLVFAETGVWAGRGDLQLVVRHLEPRGRGALQLAVEQLRARLEREGLFDPARKRPLPPWPRRIGVVTSPHGAAVRDVIEVTGRRLRGVPLLIAPTRVQGEGAEHEIRDALEALAARADVDVIVLVRGGGSLEDLMPFNTELLARAIAASCVPVVCGVGHEIDVTIADLVADARAPTPSAAAALVLADGAALRERLRRDSGRLATAARGWLGRAAARLEARTEALRHVSPVARLALRGARLRAAQRALAQAVTTRLERGRGGVAALAGRLDSLSPLAVLARGYAIARRGRDGAVVRRPTDVREGERLDVRVAEGEIQVLVVAPAAPRKASRSR